MDVSPVDDTFLSGAQDDTVRLWDTRSQNCQVRKYFFNVGYTAYAISQGLLNIAGRPSVTYDPSGLIFAVTLNLKSSTLLYDIRMLDVVCLLHLC
jgi:COMPASS component SWD2